MLNIGEFPQFTGLTGKALRLSDKRGVFSPPSVGPWSGYRRRYDIRQPVSGFELKALRKAGAPLDDPV